MQQLSKLSQEMSEIEQEYGITLGDFVCWKNGTSVGYVRAIVPAGVAPLAAYPYKLPDIIEMNVTLTFATRGPRVLIQRSKKQKEKATYLSEWLAIAVDSIKLCDASKVTQETEAG